MDIKSLGTILGIWAHPDDETILTGGIMAAARANKQRVICVTATRGEAGSQDQRKWPPASLAAVRTQELDAALKILDIKHHRWLDFADGACQRITDDDAMAKLLPLLERYQPDTILTFPPNGLTGHVDHQIVSRWAWQAATRYPKDVKVYCAVATQEAYQSHLQKWDEAMNVFFNLEEPELYPQKDCDIVYQLPPEILAKKLQAIAAMPSQTALMQQKLDPTFLRGLFATETLRRLGKFVV